MAASMWDLDAVISALLTSRILVQFLGQVLAVRHLRRHRPEVARPFRMFLYPLPCVVAFGGWTYIFVTSGWKYVSFGISTLAVGGAVYWIWSRGGTQGESGGGEWTPDGPG